MAKLNLRRFIKIAAVITLILAVIEVAVIFVMSEKKEKTASRKNNDSTKQIIQAAEKDTPVNSSSGYAANPYSTLTPDDSSVHAAPNAKEVFPKVQTAKSVKRDSLVAKAKPAPDTLSVPLPPAPKAVVKTPPVKLNPTQLLNILNDVLAEKKRLNIAAKCVQVQKSRNSNVSNAFEVADFLQSNGFIISGRLSGTPYHTGISMHTEGDCIVVTIGNM